MTNKPYNNAYNYETWAVSLWMDNDEGTYTYVREMLREMFASVEANAFQTKERALVYEFQNWLKKMHEENMPEVEGVYSDLLTAAMSEVNWYEIAEGIIEECNFNFEEEEDEDEEEEDVQLPESLTSDGSIAVG